MLWVAHKCLNGWNGLENCKEAIFAVKKEHEMLGYDLTSINYSNKKGLNFEETAVQAITNRKNTFCYHGNEYSLKKSTDEEIFVIRDGIIVANILTDGEKFLTEIIEGKENYIENFLGKNVPIIKNGYLINKNEFIKKENTREVEEK